MNYASRTIHTRALNQLLIALSYLALSVIATFPLVGEMRDHVPMPTYIHHIPWVHYLWKQLWWLWYNKFSMFQLHELPIATDFIFYPVGIKSASYFVQCLSPALCFSILLLALRDVITAGNSLLLISLALSGYSAYLLGKYVLHNGKAAYLSGVCFGFCSAQLGNAQGHLIILASLPLIPLFILFLIKTTKEDNKLNCYFLAGTCFFLFLGYWYFIVFCMIFGVVYFLLEIPSLSALKNLLRASIASALVILPVVAWVLSQKEISYSAPLGSAENWSVDLAAFFLPSAEHPIWGPFFLRMRNELLANPTIQSAYLGYPILLAAFAAFSRNNWRDLKVWVLTFLIFSILALGPFLHILGESGFHLFGNEFRVPLPFKAFRMIPIFDAVRDCSMFLAMSTLAIAILAGFGFKRILEKVTHKRLFFCVFLCILILDSSIYPFPVFQVEVPKLYKEIRKSQNSGRVLVDVPLNPQILTYEFYQTLHHQKILLGGFSRMPEFYYDYGDDLPIIGIFKNPQRLNEVDNENSNLSRFNARWIKSFFDIGTIVLHRRFLTQSEFQKFQKLVKDNFNVVEVLSDDTNGDIAYRLGQMPVAGSWDEIHVDFGSPPPHYFVKKGWGASENWGEGLNICWSDHEASDLFLILDPSTSYRGSFRLFPFSYPGSPQQTMDIYINGRHLETLSLSSQWKIYNVLIPSKLIVSGVNHIRFAYRYAKRPCDVLPNSTDTRTLGVAFDYLNLFKQDSKGPDEPG